MNKTKRQILDAALKLFNEQGLSQVSLRAIADEIKISPGNLTYHFKRREEIVEVLYYEFVAVVDERFGRIEPGAVNLSLIFELITILTETRLRYRFLMRDFTALVAENPSIKKHYALILKKRREQSLFFFEKLVAQKVLRPAELPNEYHFLYERIQILGNFWITSAIMQGDKLTSDTVRRNFEMIVQIIYPYLTVSGKREWVALKKAVK